MNEIERELENPHTRARLLAAATRILGNAHDAEDCLQDALILATLNAHRYEARSEASGWLYRVVVNACRMRLRAQRTERRGGGHAHMPLDELVSHPAGGDTPEELLQSAQTLAAVRRAFAGVPARDAAIFERSVVEDLPLAALAEQHDMTRQALKARLYRVRKQLGASLARCSSANLRPGA